MGLRTGEDTMTEKRFTLELYDGTMHIKSIKDNGEIIYPNEIVDLLNSLVEENEQLKSACAKYDINPKNLEKVLDDFDSMLDWEYSGNLNDDGEYK